MNKDIFASAERNLAMRMHSVHEMRTKLRKKYPENPQEIEKVIEYFLKNKILDDTEFARTYLTHRQLQKPKSTFVLQKELQQKGIDPHIQKEVIAESIIDDEKSAKELAKRKMNSIRDNLDISKKKDRMIRYLNSQGFSYEIIRKIVDEMLTES
jgi:regulatory protein